MSLIISNINVHFHPTAQWFIDDSTGLVEGDTTFAFFIIMRVFFWGGGGGGALNMRIPTSGCPLFGGN